MAYNVKNFWRATKRNDCIKTLIRRRFLTAKPQLTLQANRSALAKITKPSLIQWNSALTLSNGTTQYSSNAQFHHLAEHTLVSNAVYVTDVGFRNFARATKEVPSQMAVGHMKNIRDFYDNARFEKEKQRLKRKGVMKDITIKIPEGVMYAKL